jgi:hypothetical protein
MKLTKLSLLLAFGFLVTACGQEMSTPGAQVQFNPAELEPDYPEGFFNKELDMTAEDEEGGETHTILEDVDGAFAPQDFQALFRFAQTTWDECREDVTGNYTGANCLSKRHISVILKSFLADHLFQCVDEGLNAQGGGVASELHITHAGIAGDPRHSPRSLHAENRAIDIKSLQVVLSNGQSKLFTYSKMGNRPFYSALRRCWGRVVNRENECPLYSGSSLYTGSIGWENSQHGMHMHLSVPYCFNNQHGSFFWRR